MVIFEVMEKEKKRIFIANYRKEDERLFPINLDEATILSDDIVINMENAVSIRRHTEGCFVKQQFHIGDRVVLFSDGRWSYRHSFQGHVVALCKGFVSYCKELFFVFKEKGDEFGFIERKVVQACCHIDLVDID